MNQIALFSRILVLLMVVTIPSRGWAALEVRYDWSQNHRYGVRMLTGNGERTAQAILLKYNNAGKPQYTA